MADRRKKHDPKLAKLYAEAKRNFTAADLQKYMEDTPTVPLQQVMTELEAIYKKHTEKKSNKTSSKRQNGSHGRKKSA